MKSKISRVNIELQESNEIFDIKITIDNKEPIFGYINKQCTEDKDVARLISLASAFGFEPVNVLNFDILGVKELVKHTSE